MVLDVSQHLRGSENALKFLAKNDTIPAGAPVGNHGAHDLASIIWASLFGFADQARTFLHRSNSWIDEGLSSQEYNRFGASPAEHRFFLHQSRAVGSWLENNELATEHWDEARRFSESWWHDERHPWTRHEIIRDGLDVYLPMAVLGGIFEDYKHGKESFEAGIEMYEHWIGKADISLKKQLKPRDLGYAMCRHYLNDEFAREDLLLAGRRMLSARLSNEIGSGWLENGAFIEATMWLIAIYWYPALHYGEPLPEPQDVLLKVYDDMKDVVRPF